jgi:hypothetical protein
MGYNNEFILQSLGKDPHAPLSPIASSSSILSPPRHDLLPRTPTLAHQLPSTITLDEEAVRSSSIELNRQSLQVQRERELAEALAEEERIEQRRELKESQGTWTSLIVGRRKGKGQEGSKALDEGKTKGFDRPPQAYELYAAIDKKDLKWVTSWS